MVRKLRWNGWMWFIYSDKLCQKLKNHPISQKTWERKGTNGVNGWNGLFFTLPCLCFFFCPFLWLLHCLCCCLLLFAINPLLFYFTFEHFPLSSHMPCPLYSSSVLSPFHTYYHLLWTPIRACVEFLKGGVHVFFASHRLHHPCNRTLIENR